MRKNKFVVAMTLLFCLCIFPVISSVEWDVNYSLDSLSDGITISQSTIIESNFEVTETQPSDFGGLISSCENTISKILDFLGILNLNTIEIIEPLENYELLIFPAGENPNFETVSYGSIFAQSEEIILPDRTTTPHIWTTTSITVEIPGEDFLAQPFDSVSTDFGNIQFTNWLGPEATYKINGGSDLTTLKLDCLDNHCPTTQQIQENFPDIDYIGMNYVVIPEFNNMIIVVLKIDTENYVAIIVDADNNGEWTFLTLVEGFSVNSFEKNVLAITEPGTYDVFVIK